LLYQFTRNQRHKTWPDKTDRDVVEKILRSDYIKHKLEINTEKTAVAKKSIVQNGNDLDFIRKLAKRNCFELSINGNKVYFGPHKESQTPIVTLDYGKSLLSFNPELNIANQVSEVEVRGWDVIAKREIIGKAKSEGSKDCKNGGEIMEKLYGHVEMVVTDKPVKSQQEADALAKSIFKEKANEFIRGNAESIGIPDIRAGTPIMLKGVGKLFSRKYFIERSTHTINSSGYKTTFNVKGCTK